MKRAEAERRERELAAERKRKIERARTECFAGCDFFRGCTFDADDGRTPQIAAICKGYADTFSRDDMNGLLLWGKVGTGKSFYASAIANRVIDLGFSALQTSVQDIVTHIESVPFNEREKAKSRLLKYDLLVIDDLGAHRSTDYVMGHVYDIIDSRYKNRRPMIVTTNLDPNIATKSDADDAPWPRIFTRNRLAWMAGSHPEPQLPVIPSTPPRFLSLGQRDPRCLLHTGGLFLFPPY